MTRAAGMFGSDAAAKRLHAKLRNERIHIERHNFRHPDDLLAHLADAPDTAAVLLVEKALKEYGVTKALEHIREAEPTVRIIFIRDEPERDYNFELWCHERGIYDTAYPSRHTDVNIDAIRDAILSGRIDPENPPPPPSDPNAAQEQTVRLRDRITLPNIKLPSWKIPTLSEWLPKREPNIDSDIHTIGVINCSRGFGATSLVVGMARLLTDTGHSVAAVAMDLGPDLLYSGLRELGVTVDVPSGDSLPDWDALKKEHDIVLIDFGVIYDFLPSGGVIPAQSGAAAAIAVRDAMRLCDVRIYLASSEPWHMNKAGAFDSDADGCVVFRQDADASAILHTMGVIQE